MRHSEWVALVYFLFLAAASMRLGMARGRRLALLALSTASAAGIVAVAATAGMTIRNWAPLAYVLVGYYASGLLFVRPSARFESWLIGWDRRWLGDPTTRFSQWHRWLTAYLDLLYMGCFLLLPAGFALLTAYGHSALADRYWTMVLGSEFGSFAPLAFAATRPPWILEREAVLPDGRVHRAAAKWVRGLTIGVNTFPSGHAAGSLAVALGVIGVLPGVGVVLLVLAASIGMACVVGRYHYVIDVIAGFALATAVWAGALAIGA